MTEKKTKIYRGELVYPEKEETEKDTKISPLARAILEIVGEDEFLGFYRIPENHDEALKYVSQRVLFQEPVYGKGENRFNGYDLDLAEAIVNKAMDVMQSAFRDDAKKPTIYLEVIPHRSWWMKLFRKPAKFKVKLRYAKLSVDGHVVGWSKPHHTDARYEKLELIPLAEDLALTKVPTVYLNE